MKSVIFFLLSLLPQLSGAETDLRVSVIWASALRHPDGHVQPQLPPAEYLARLRACGVEVRGLQRSLFPVPKLLGCPGVLSFREEARHKKQVSALLQNLLRNKVSRIAGADVAEILKKMEGIRMGVSPHGIFEAAVDPSSPELPRHAAINIASERLVILNTPLWVYTSQEFRDLLLLHEVLGAAGFNDEHYELTLKTWWLARHPERIPDYQDGHSPLLPESLFETAGVSVVGHGGDFAQIQFKASLLEATRRNLEVIGNGGQPVPKRFLPTKKEEEEAVFSALVFSMPTRKMLEGGLCAVPGSQEQNRIYCGGFMLKGKTGAPFLVISRDWGSFPENQRWQLVLKVYVNMQTGFVCSKGYPCGG